MSSDFIFRCSSSCSSRLIARASCNCSSSSPRDEGRTFSISDDRRLSRLLVGEPCKDQSSQSFNFYYFSNNPPGPQVIKIFSCSTQPSMNFFQLINVKMQTIVGILTFMSRKIAFYANLSLQKDEFLDIFILMCI